MTSAPAQRWIWRTHLFQFNGTSLRRRATPGPGDLPGGGSAGRGRWWWRSTAAAPRCPGRRTAAPGAAHRPPRHWPPRPPLSWVNRCSVRDDAQPRERGAALIGRDAARDVAIGVVGGLLHGTVCARHGRDRRGLTALFTSALILASSAAVNSVSAKEVGHMAPSSRFAALWKKQTTLPSLSAYAGIPYQVFGERDGALALMISWSRSAMARSGSDISAIFASTAPSPAARSLFARASAFSSWARSFIAARSSSVNPLNVVPLAVVLLADLCVAFSALIVASCAGSPMSYSAQQDLAERPPYQRISWVTWMRLPQVSFSLAIFDPVTSVGGMVNSAPRAFMRS